jgi:hypothetical protein
MVKKVEAEELNVPVELAMTPIPEDQPDYVISGSSSKIDGSYGLQSAITISAALEMAIIAHMNAYGKVVTSEQLVSIAEEMLR